MQLFTPKSGYGLLFKFNDYQQNVLLLKQILVLQESLMCSITPILQKCQIISTRSECAIRHVGMYQLLLLSLYNLKPTLFIDIEDNQSK